MPPKSTPRPSDIDTSIQIALDAADAAMDVTAEYARVSADFRKTRDSLLKIEKLSKIALAGGAGVGLVALLAMMFSFSGAKKELSLMQATNTELLGIFTQNVATMRDGVAGLEPGYAVLEELSGRLEGLEGAIADISALREEVAQLSLAVSETQTAMMTRQAEAEAALTGQMDALGERIATLNGELVMTTMTDIDDRIREQTELIGATTEEFIAGLAAASANAAEASTNSEAMQGVIAAQTRLEERLEDLTRRTRALSARAAAPRPAQDDGVIKYP